MLVLYNTNSRSQTDSKTTKRGAGFKIVSSGGSIGPLDRPVGLHSRTSTKVACLILLKKQESMGKWVDDGRASESMRSDLIVSTQPEPR
jgi:hypothetical protein